MPNVKDVEKTLCRALEKIAGLVRDGISPNNAIVKVASEEKLSAGNIKLVVNAYNNGRTAQQRNTHSDPFDKAAEFELADAATILNEIFPRHVKSANEAHRETTVAEEYDYEPTWIKKATYKADPVILEDFVDQPLQRDPNRFDKKARGLLQKLAKQREELYMAAEKIASELSHAYGNLVHYFKQSQADPIDDVEANCRIVFGDDVSGLFAKIAEETTPLKVKVVHRFVGEQKDDKKKKKVIRVPMRRTETPYKEISACVKAASAYAQLVDVIEDFEKKAFSTQLQLERAIAGLEPAPLEPDYKLSIVRRLAGEKRSFLSSSIGGGATFALGAHTANSILKELEPESKDDLRKKTYVGVIDPSHETKLRAIRTQAALHGLLNSPYFEGEDPYKVTDIFNNVVKMSPRIADQPLALESLLRRYMAQGQTDSHDLDQLLAIETKLKQRDEPSREQHLPQPLEGKQKPKDAE